MKMEKKVFEFLDGNSASRITAAAAHAAGFPTAKAAKDALHELKAKRAVRKDLREEAHEKERNPYCKRIQQYAEKRGKEIRDALRLDDPLVDGYYLYGSNELTIKVNECADWGEYKKGYGRIWMWDLKIIIPKGGIRLVKGDWVTMIAKRQKSINSLTQTDGLLLNRGIDRDEVWLSPCTMVSDGIHVAHGDTPQKALAALQRKQGIE